jgi:hypothetical protein
MLNIKYIIMSTKDPIKFIIERLFESYTTCSALKEEVVLLLSKSENISETDALERINKRIQIEKDKFKESIKDLQHLKEYQE